MSQSESQLIVSRLKQISARKGLAQIDLAERAGLSQSQISRLWSSETKSPSRDTLIKIATALDISLDEVVNSIPVRPSSSPSHSYLNRYNNEPEYASAKVLMVGEQGIGKSSLAWRLTQTRFIQTKTTDDFCANQIKISVDADEGKVREIWLWDFAGQSDFRLMPLLFADNISLVIFVIDPSKDNCLEEIERLDRRLEKISKRPFRKLLVATRNDRGETRKFSNRLAEAIEKKNFGHFIDTSVLSNRGINEFLEAIKENIDWNTIPGVSSARDLNLLKEEIIKSKDEGRVLLTLPELKLNFEMGLPDKKYALGEFRQLVDQLAESGLIWFPGFGDIVILKPKKVDFYATAIMNSARAQADGIGCVSEDKILRGDLNCRDIIPLEKNEKEIVLNALRQELIESGLCSRVNTENGVWLTFPSYFDREREPLERHPDALITYSVDGGAEEIFAAIVTGLYHSYAFEHDKTWYYAADFKTLSGKRVGLKLSEKEADRSEISVYFEEEIHDDTCILFLQYVHKYLDASGKSVTRTRSYFCPLCKRNSVNEEVATIRRSQGFTDAVCQICEVRVPIKDAIEEKFGQAGQPLSEER